MRTCFPLDGVTKEKGTKKDLEEKREKPPQTKPTVVQALLQTMSDRPAETEYSALQALLQIRTNSGEGNAEAADTSSPTTANEAASAVAAGAPAAANPSQQSTSINAANANANAKIANLLRMGASSAILQQAQMTYPPASQLAAIRATAAAASLHQNPNGALLQAAALQNPTFAGTGTITSPFLEAMARDPALVAAAVATAPRAPTLDLPRSPALSPLRPAATGLSHGGSISPAQPSLTTDTTTTTTVKHDAQEEKKIRKDEVEAALRSKPQRGRKRENLNAEERLELTRTRNREHAKSTRIRKKARYQELLDTEQKYLELKNMEELESKRRDTVMGFLDARASMLQSSVKKTLKPKQVSPESQKVAASAEKGESTVKTALKSKQVSPASQKGAASEGKGESSDDEPCTPKAGLKVDDTAKSLKDFLEDENSFGFETSLGDIHAIDASAMIRFDESIARRLEQMLGPSATSCRIAYRVLGSFGGIALNKDGTGFARVEHIVSNPPPQQDAAATSSKDEKLLLSSLVSFEFVKDSHLIKSVAWSILKDSMGISGGESVNGSKSDSTAKESLESQTVYPSVVSFDDAHKEKAKIKAAGTAQAEQPQEPNDQMDNNPGMSI